MQGTETNNLNEEKLVLKRQENKTRESPDVIREAKGRKQFRGLKENTTKLSLDR